MTRRSFVALLGGLAGVLGGVTALSGAARAVPAGIPVGTVIGRLRVVGWRRYVTPGVAGVGFRCDAVDTVSGGRAANAVRLVDGASNESDDLATGLLRAWLTQEDHDRTTGHTTDACLGRCGHAWAS